VTESGISRRGQSRSIRQYALAPRNIHPGCMERELDNGDNYSYAYYNPFFFVFGLLLSSSLAQQLTTRDTRYRRGMNDNGVMMPVVGGAGHQQEIRVGDG